MCEQTPFEAAGYTKDDTFVVSGPEVRSYSFGVGSIIKLNIDDGSNCPRFELVQGSCTSENRLGYEYIRNIVKIAKNQTPFEAAGYTKDDLFIIASYIDSYLKGVVFKLQRDDGTNNPYFKSVTPGENQRLCPRVDDLIKIRL